MYLHTLNLTNPAAVVDLTLPEDFSVAAGINGEAQLVFPACDNPSYIIAGGPQCLQYAPRLGHGAVKQTFVFPVVVTALLVATESGLRPVPEVRIADRNLSPDNVVIVRGNRIDYRTKTYSPTVEGPTAYLTYSATWRRRDTGELLTPGPDAPDKFYMAWPYGRDDMPITQGTITELRNSYQAFSFVDEFDTF